MVVRLAESGLFESFSAELAERQALQRGSAMFRWLQDHGALIAFLGLILVGIGLHYLTDFIREDRLALSWLRSASRPLSDALIVAAFLGMTVDTFLKRALIRDVGAIFIGSSLPHEVRNYLREVSQTSMFCFSRHWNLPRFGVAGPG